MMEASPPDENVDLSGDRWILLVFAREWPRYIVEWSIRQQSGESDFPVLSGRIVREPDRDRSSEEIWNDARELAIEEASAALARHETQLSSGRKGLLARLLGR